MSVDNDTPTPSGTDKRQLPRRTAELSAEIVGIIGMIDQSIIIFADKRTTLEEQAICRYFNELAGCYGHILAILHGQAADGALATPAPAEQDLVALNTIVLSTLQDLLKGLKHSLNYVEQYFEYDF